MVVRERRINKGKSRCSTINQCISLDSDCSYGEGSLDKENAEIEIAPFDNCLRPRLRPKTELFPPPSGVPELSSNVFILDFPLETGQALAKCPDPPQYMHSPSFMRRDRSAGVMGPRRLEVDRSMTSESAEGVGAGRGAGVVGLEEVLVIGVDGAEEEREVPPYVNGLRSDA